MTVQKKVIADQISRESVNTCGKMSHKAENCWVKEENADKRPKGWVSCKEKNEANGSNKKEVGATNIEFVL